MAQVPPSPWSRWDAPGYQYVSNKTKQPFPLQYDSEFENSGLQFGNATRQRLVGAGRLVDQKINRKQEKYAWAIALLAIFCFVVLFSLFMILFCWLYNRARDKRQKRFIGQSMGGMSPAISQANLAAIENRNENGYYPYVGGPNQY
ncbi:unnamed protein product [Acanthocheilonema viteae]|uniref:Uncharacterized protein n=1 Tax=Acanthocheilonema viteae TaxID=6277 RepID=A0A498S2S5_ACAVI|nr:unnamed protein product [Acanthocheilonema viteae]